MQNVELENDYVELPNGIYTGQWCAYTVKFNGIELASINGIRGSTEVQIIVDNNRAKVQY
jgi:hypothetical protein